MLKSKERLRLNGLFEQAYQSGKTLTNSCLRLTFTKTLEKFQNQFPLVGFSVSKKFSKRAIDRNRIKRQLREIYRLYRLKNKSNVTQHGLIVISPKNNALNLSYDKLKIELENLLDKSLSS